MRLVGRTPTQILERRHASLTEELLRLRKIAARRNRTCKTGDDVFFDRLVKRGKAMHVARRTIDDELLHILNTFPIDTPCTIKVVATRIGARAESVERILIEESRTDHRDEVDSDKRVFIFTPKNWFADYIVKTICQPNWRFVDDGKYVERYEMEED